MNFVKQEIESKIIWIIDVWTYKARVAIAKYQNKDLELIWYWEKRQDFTNNCLENFVDINNWIQDSLKKAENNWKTKIKEIIINIPFQDLFFETSKINYIRKDTNKDIDIKELNTIINEIKNIAFKKAFKNIFDNYSYEKNQLKLLICNISNILLDKVESKEILWKNPKEINIKMLNIFIPYSKYENIEAIARNIDKKIIKIIPSEYAVAKLDYNKKDVVIIDLWSCHTSIIVKQNNNIIWAKKIPVWIRELIIDICKNHKKTRCEVIDTIEENIYVDEKLKFLEIFTDVIAISLEEILWNNICPDNFFMIGWWSNKFVKKYIEEIDFNEFGLKIAKKITFITPNIEYLDDIDSSKSNLNIYAMMKCSIDFIKRKKDPIEEILKKIMNDY